MRPFATVMHIVRYTLATLLIVATANAAPSARGVEASKGKAGGAAASSNSNAPSAGSSKSGGSQGSGKSSGSGNKSREVAADESGDSANGSSSNSSQNPQFAVGDTAPSGASLKPFFQGMDLPRAKQGQAYMRTDEFIYRLERGSRRVLEIIPIHSVLLW